MRYRTSQLFSYPDAQPQSSVPQRPSLSPCSWIFLPERMYMYKSFSLVQMAAVFHGHTVQYFAFLYSRLHSFIHAPPIKCLFSCYSMPDSVLPAGEVMTNSIQEHSSQGKPIVNIHKYTNKQALLFQVTSAIRKQNKVRGEGRTG